MPSPPERERERLSSDEGAGRKLCSGPRITEALIELIRGLEIRPRFILAKGSTTSSNVTTRALGVDRAIILGQLLPGVPVWRLGLESDFPGLIYIPFAGSFGASNALAGALQALNGDTSFQT